MARASTTSRNSVVWCIYEDFRGSPLRASKDKDLASPNQVATRDTPDTGENAGPAKDGSGADAVIDPTKDASGKR